MRWEAHLLSTTGGTTYKSLGASRLVFAVLLLVSPIIFWTGCSQPQNPGDSAQKMSHVITADTPYYLNGPQQARPPDGTLRAGTQITIVESQGSYSVVRTKDGMKAHVASDSFKPLSP
jgi:hypothetical protein